MNDRCEQWADRFTDPTSYQTSLANYPAGVVMSPQGDRAYVAGTTTVNGQSEIAVASFNTATGALIWIDHGPLGPPTAASAITISRDGSKIFVAGEQATRYSLTEDPYVQVYTMAVAAKTGHTLWSARTAGEGSQVNAATAISVDPQGRWVAVAGYSMSPGNFQRPPFDYAVVAYPTNGGRALWQTFYRGEGGRNFALAMQTSPAGDRLFVTGYSERRTSNPSIPTDDATLAIATNTGNIGWSARYSGAGGLHHNFAFDVAIDPRGKQVVVTGASEYGDAGLLQYSTVSYSASSGHQQWAAQYLGATNGNDIAAKVASSPSGAVFYVTGQSEQLQQPTGNSTVNGQIKQRIPSEVTVAYAANGRQLWTARYAPPGEYSAGVVLTVSRAGNIYVGTTVGLPAGTLIWPGLVAYDAKGVQQWVSRYDVRDPTDVSTPVLGPSNGPVGLVASPNGKAVMELSLLAPATTAESLECTANSTAGNSCRQPPLSFDLVATYAP